ncbi:MAG TPA: hypothetical protein VH621_02775 [Nitrososphaera sp.]|jgi:hypothetical protein
MCAHHEESTGGYGKDMKIVAWSILAMGISIAIVIMLWGWFGHIGPKFSDEVMREQQTTLREKYGLPPAPIITEKEAEIPPSLRGK